jgi:hypothetical protein
MINIVELLSIGGLMGFKSPLERILSNQWMMLLTWLKDICYLHNKSKQIKLAPNDDLSFDVGSEANLNTSKTWNWKSQDKEVAF